MGIFYNTLIHLNSNKKAKEFLLDFNEKLEKIGLEISNDSFIIYNNEDLDKDPIYISGMSSFKIINLLCEDPKLGLLEYQLANNNFPILINYIGENNTVNYIIISVKASIIRKDNNILEYKKTINKMLPFISFKIIVGDFGLLDNYSNSQLELFLSNEINNKTFDIFIEK